MKNTLLGLIIGLFTFLNFSFAGQSARDDVPAETSKLKNPVTLTEKKIRYFKRHFKSKCSSCHGREGTPPEKRMSDKFPPRNFTDSTFMKTRTDGDLYYQIRAGGSERTAMPAFGPGSPANWTDEKIWGMVAFIRQFAK